MAKPTIVFGLILIVLGLGAYFTSTPTAPAPADGETVEAGAEAPPAKRSITAMIPAFLGAPLLLCGFLALDEKKLKHAMHGAAVIGLLGALAGLGRGLMVLAKGGDYNVRAVVVTLLMGAICALFVFMCVRSFIAAKKRRLAAEAGS